MSHVVYEQFQTEYPDPDKPTILPSNVAQCLAKRPDYKQGNVRKLTSTERSTYNVILADNGKGAADQWLNREWA